jgi:hypothetical protein
MAPPASRLDAPKLIAAAVPLPSYRTRFTAVRRSVAAPFATGRAVACLNDTAGARVILAGVWTTGRAIVISTDCRSHAIAVPADSAAVNAVRISSWRNHSWSRTSHARSRFHQSRRGRQVVSQSTATTSARHRRSYANDCHECALTSHDIPPLPISLGSGAYSVAQQAMRATTSDLFKHDCQSGLPASSRHRLYLVPTLNYPDFLSLRPLRRRG